MEDEELETYVEVPTEDDYEDYEDDSIIGDVALITFLAILGCAVFAFVVKTISKHLKNVNLKVGDKIQLGIESKEKEEEKR